MAPQTQLPVERVVRPRRSLRIVVADDDQDAVITLATVLRHEGHEVREAHRGDAVLGLLREFQPDAILLDIGMPGMTGYDVARNLRERLGDACPLLIAITGWKKSADRILGQIVGFDHYMTKPYSTDELLALLEPLASSSAWHSRARRPTPTKQQNLLAQAAKLLGEKELAEGLKVSETLLDSWIEGRAAMPERHLLALADLLVKLAGKPHK